MLCHGSSLGAVSALVLVFCVLSTVICSYSEKIRSETDFWMARYEKEMKIQNELNEMEKRCVFLDS